MSEELEITPGGYRPKANVHQVGPDHAIRMLRGRLLEIDPAGKVVADLGLLADLPPGLPLMPRNVRRGARGPIGLTSGWISYADWTNTTGKSVSYFATSWTVPPAPSTHSGQTIYLFSGMQDSTTILQPVLQWGPSPAGGNDSWMVASWYVDGPGGVASHSNLHPVRTGDVIVGVITLTNRSADGFTYRCEFQRISDSSLVVQDVRELTWCCETLEAYGLTHASDYPATNATAFRAIELRVGEYPPTDPPLLWTPVDAVTDTGQHTNIVSNANPGGEVAIHYR